MTTRADVQQVFDKLADAATTHTVNPSDANGKRLLSLLRELEMKSRAVGEEGTALSAAEYNKSGQSLGRAHDDLGAYLNNGALDAMQRQFDSLAGS